MSKKQTPLQKVIDFIDSETIDPISIKEFAQSLLPEEREGYQAAYNQSIKDNSSVYMAKEPDFKNANDYFTNTFQTEEDKTQQP